MTDNAALPVETPASEVGASATETPAAEYRRRQEDARTKATRRERQHRTMGNWRLLVFAAGAAIAFASWGQGVFSGWWLLIPVFVFVLLAVSHERILRELRRQKRRLAFYESGLRRLENRWVGYGTAGTAYLTAEHPYARDLDLFGKGSLFELLCTARTRTGQDTLAAWLSAPADVATIRARQEAAAELRPRLTLREEIAILGDAVEKAVRPEALMQWGEQTAPTVPRFVRLLALLSATGVVVLVGAGIAGYGYAPAILLILLQQILIYPYRKRMKCIVQELERPAKELEILALLLGRVEQERFQSVLLSRLLPGERLLSARIARLQRLCELLDLRRNELLAIVDAALLWSFQFTALIEDWRQAHGAELRDWLRIVGDFEALNALANYAYEHPADPFPEIVDGPACLFGTALGHPLLSETACIRNEVRLDSSHRLYIVSGSNMSGKSTYLRTIGSNAVLALAGATVRAERLTLTPLFLGASIQTNDSLQAGMSRFYAEITRLRQVVDMAKDSPPLLFLLDEILHGTNSHDRRVGAEAIVQTLLTRNALGLITTHDLALARIAEERSDVAHNVHFQDDLVAGQMHFDYRLHPGVVEKSNAIALMRAVGLEV